MNIPAEIEELKNDLLWANYDLNEYKDIFINNTQTIDLINETAPVFFVRLKKFYWNHFIISISRFVDPHTQFRHNNISTKWLVKHANTETLPFTETLNKTVCEVDELSIPFKDYRSKFFVHRDLDYATKKDLKLEPLCIENVELIYSKIAKCLNLFYEHYTGGTHHFSYLNTNKSGRSLLYYLLEGAIYTELKEQRRNPELDQNEKESTKYEDFNF